MGTHVPGLPAEKFLKQIRCGERTRHEQRTIRELDTTSRERLGKGALSGEGCCSGLLAAESLTRSRQQINEYDADGQIENREVQ